MKEAFVDIIPRAEGINLGLHLRDGRIGALLAGIQVLPEEIQCGSCFGCRAFDHPVTATQRVPLDQDGTSQYDDRPSDEEWQRDACAAHSVAPGLSAEKGLCLYEFIWPHQQTGNVMSNQIYLRYRDSEMTGPLEDRAAR